MRTQQRRRGSSRSFASSYLKAGDLPGDGLAELRHGVRVLAAGDHEVVPDGREALVVQQLILDLRQAGLELFLIAHISVGSNKDDGRQRSDGLTQEREKTCFLKQAWH